MYESYAWPGACSYKSERRLFIKWFKELLTGVLKRIEKAEKVV